MFTDHNIIKVVAYQAGNAMEWVRLIGVAESYMRMRMWDWAFIGDLLTLSNLLWGRGGSLEENLP